MARKKPRKAKSDTVVMPLRLNPSLVARIRLRAERERRTMANLVRLILENAVRRGA
jgi:hypothetical protein